MVLVCSCFMFLGARFPKNSSIDVGVGGIVLGNIFDLVSIGFSFLIKFKHKLKYLKYGS